MSRRWHTRFTTRTATGLAALVLMFVPLVVPSAPLGMPSAAAASCSPVELVFARGRLEPPGAGKIGTALVGALRSKANRSVGLYSVQYAADTDVDRGANDMSAHVQYMINNCPDTRLVLGGYSLGAAATDVVLAVPTPMFGFSNPLPAGADGHIAAVALFGNGSAWVGPITNFNPVYRERTIEMCHGADPICNPADPNTWADNWPQHLADAYINAGMVNEAADFVAAHL